MLFEKVSVVGLGYIGLPTAALMASRGVEVIGVDVNASAVDIINAGDVHIVEPDLDIVVRSVVQTGNLKATLSPIEAQAFLIAVPTPFNSKNQPDLAFIESAARSIAPVLEAGNIVILESTVPVGTTELLSKWLGESRPDLTFPHDTGEKSDIRVAHCPERVLPGHVLQELVNNDRIIGGITRACADLAVSLYRTFVKGDCLVTDVRTAELCKLTENAYRDVNIAFANEMSLICDELDVDVWELIALTNRHPRVSVLKPGPGVGGHCIAVDPWFIVSSTPKTARLIKTAREVNDAKPVYIRDRIVDKARRFRSPSIACLGLAFKADIDDLRQSPALNIVRELSDADVGRLLVVEPNVADLPSTLSGTDNIFLMDTREALEQADIVVCLVAHREFRELTLTAFAEKIVIDACGLMQ